MAPYKSKASKSVFAIQHSNIFKINTETIMNEVFKLAGKVRINTRNSGWTIDVDVVIAALLLTQI